jgi:hypothetical protein
VGFDGVTGLRGSTDGRAYLHSLGAPKGAPDGFSGGVFIGSGVISGLDDVIRKQVTRGRLTGRGLKGGITRWADRGDCPPNGLTGQRGWADRGGCPPKGGSGRGINVPPINVPPIKVPPIKVAPIKGGVSYGANRLQYKASQATS